MANTCTSVPLESWSHFTEVIRDGLVHGLDGIKLTDIWFRGQADENWPLMASFDRQFGTFPSKVRIAAYAAMVKEFRDRVVNTGQLGVLDDDSIVAVMQHYGAPTRSLDWSTSPFVAAYFALEGGGQILDQAGRCAVYALRARGDALVGLETLRLLETPARENSRALAQRGRYTLNVGTNPDLWEEIRLFKELPSERDDSWVLRKYTIPLEDAILGLRELDLMAINAETLFPGLEGVAKTVFVHALHAVITSG